MGARLATTGAEGRTRAPTDGDVMDTSATVAGKMGRAPVDAVENSDVPLEVREERCRVGDLHFAYVADKEVVKGRAQWQNPVVKSRLGATQSSVADGVPDWARN